MRLLGVFFLYFWLFCRPFPCGYAEQVLKEPYADYELKCGQSGGKLTLSTASEPKSFNPIVAQETSTTQVTGFIFEGLTRTHPLTLEVLPNLAQNWQVDASGKEWVFNLRRDVYWNDGHKFSADDVLFTYKDLIYNPDIPNSARDIFTVEGKKIEVEKIDDYTVRFKLPFVFAPFLRAAAQEILPAHKYKNLVTQKNFTFSLNVGSKACDIVGTGPFRLKTYLAGERIILERNPFYWRKDSCANRLPYLDEIVFIILPSSDTALLKFLEKEIDYYPVNAQDLSILGPRRRADNFTIYNAGPAFVSNFIAFNQNAGANPETKKSFVKPYKLKWFRNKDFRQAVSYALNRQKIIELAMNTLGAPAYSPESPANTFFYSDKIEKYPFNPLKAKAIMNNLGFRDVNNDGVLEDTSGNRLEIDFYTNANDIERVKIATMIKKDLEDIGIKINFLSLDFNNLVAKLTATLDWEMVLIAFTGGIEPYFGKNVWSYKGGLHLWNLSGSAQEQYEETIENIFNESAKTLDEGKRKELFAEFQLIASRELPLIYTAVPYSLYAVRNNFGNLYPTVFGGAFGEIEYIYIQNNNQKTKN
jgi:peptide/nickel transport system substrate-binding protein